MYMQHAQMSVFLSPLLDDFFARVLNLLLLLLAIAQTAGATSAWGQPAPALRAVVSANAAPAAMSSLFGRLSPRI